MAARSRRRESSDSSTPRDSPAPPPMPGISPPRPAPRRPGLIPTDVADALSAVLTKAAAAIRENEPGSRDGGDIEHVHQMRVATRRIRAYLKAARPTLDHGAADQLRTDLSELAGALGAVRDLDVMIDRMHSEASALDGPDTAALERLLSILQTERVTARTVLIRELDKPDYQAMLAELDEAAAAPPVADPWADLRELARDQWRRLEKARGTLVKRFGENPPDDDLHELRIYGKRARYSAELLDKETGRKNSPVARFLTALAHFQEVLGDHQDACVLEERLRQMASASGDAESGIAAGRVIERCRARRAKARRDYPGAWTDVAAAAQAAFGE